MVGLAILGSSALISCTNPKNTNYVKTDSDTTTVANTKSSAESSLSDTTMVMYIGNDTDFAFLLTDASQPYMTISINMTDQIMTYWGDEAHRVMYMDVSIDELKQIILDRFNAEDTPKENELFHVGFDRSTSKSQILALKNMLLEIGVNRCEVSDIRNYQTYDKGTLPPPPQAIITREVIDTTKDGVEFIDITGDVASNSEEDETDKIFNIVEEMPEFPGGMLALMKYLQKNIKYPADCKKEGIQGRVIVQFVVNKDGSISEAEVVKPVNPHLDSEALRLVYTMPNWIPGKQKGERVRVRFTLPVSFRLSE